MSAQAKGWSRRADPRHDWLLSRAARERGVSRSVNHLTIVLEQYRRHPTPRSAGIVRAERVPATNATFSLPVGSAAVLICDTGALLDDLVASAPDHRLFGIAIDPCRCLAQ